MGREKADDGEGKVIVSGNPRRRICSQLLCFLKSEDLAHA